MSEAPSGTYFTAEGFAHAQRMLAKKNEAAREMVQLNGDGKETGEDVELQIGRMEGNLEILDHQLKPLRDALGSAMIVSVQNQAETVDIGVTIHVARTNDSGEDIGDREYTIGAFGESNPTEGLVAYDTPLGQAVRHLKVGDTAELEIGNGETTIDLTVLKIYPPNHRYRRLTSDLFDQLKEDAVH